MTNPQSLSTPEEEPGPDVSLIEAVPVMEAAEAVAPMPRTRFRRVGALGSLASSHRVQQIQQFETGVTPPPERESGLVLVVRGLVAELRRRGSN